MNVSQFMNWGFFSDLNKSKKWYENIWNEFIYYTYDKDIEDLPDFDRLETFISETWSVLTDKDFKITDSTWDAVATKGIKLDFHNPCDALMVIGPGQNQYVLGYNVLYNILAPIFKLLWDEIITADEPANDSISLAWEKFNQDFIVELLTDEKYAEKIIKIVSDPDKSILEKFFSINIVELFSKYFSSINKKIIQVIGDAALKRILNKLSGDRAKELFGVLTKDIGYPKYYKIALKVGDISGAIIFLNYKGVAFPMNLDFDDPGGMLPEVVPGFEFN